MVGNPEGAQCQCVVGARTAMQQLALPSALYACPDLGSWSCPDDYVDASLAVVLQVHYSALDRAFLCSFMVAKDGTFRPRYCKAISSDGHVARIVGHGAGDDPREA